MSAAESRQRAAELRAAGEQSARSMEIITAIYKWAILGVPLGLALFVFALVTGPRFGQVFICSGLVMLGTAMPLCVKRSPFAPDGQRAYYEQMAQNWDRTAEWHEKTGRP